MIRIAHLTGRTYRGAPTPAGQVPDFEARDFALTREAGLRVNILFEPVYWDDPDLPKRGFDAALVRSCWDYTNQTARFLNCLDAHEAAGLRIFNSPRVLRWNARKPYLAELQSAGLPVIETIWTEHADARTIVRAFEDLDAAELVLKPQVGAGSESTLRLKRNSWSAADLALGPQGPAMLQPFLPSIETEGEMSLIYFGGALSHVVRKLPGEGRWFANDLQARFEVIAPPDGALAVAEAALRAAPGPNVYARVDLVSAAPGDWLLIELELIEPYLFLGLAPDGADRLTRALLGALEGAGVFSG